MAGENINEESANLPATREQTLPAGQQDAQAALDAVASGDKKVNAFTAVALVLQNMRADLEGIKRTGQPPRWMRIVRVRDFAEDKPENFIATKAVIPITAQFVKVIGYMAELTMKAQELLTQADGGKALLEVGAGLIKTATSDPFVSSLKEAVGQEPGGPNPLSGVGPVIDTAMDIVDKIPDPEDVDIIAQELFLLLAVDQLPLPLTSAGNLDTSKLPINEKLHVDVNTTGKIRLLSWALDKPIKFGGLGSGLEISRLGSRRSWEESAGQLPSSASLSWEQEEEQLTVYDFTFSDAQAGKDIEEANALLEKLGYIEPAAADKKVFSAEFARRLRRFQKINSIPITGRLDNETINQLTNMDYEAKKLRRAKAFSAAAVQGFDDTKNPPPEAE